MVDVVHINGLTVSRGQRKYTECECRDCRTVYRAALDFEPMEPNAPPLWQREAAAKLARTMPATDKVRLIQERIVALDYHLEREFERGSSRSVTSVLQMTALMSGALLLSTVSTYFTHPRLRGSIIPWAIACGSVAIVSVPWAIYRTAKGRVSVIRHSILPRLGRALISLNPGETELQRSIDSLRGANWTVSELSAADLLSAIRAAEARSLLR